MNSITMPWTKTYEATQKQACAWYLCSDIAAYDRTDHVDRPELKPIKFYLSKDDLTAADAFAASYDSDGGAWRWMIFLGKRQLNSGRAWRYWTELHDDRQRQLTTRREHRDEWHQHGPEHRRGARQYARPLLPLPLRQPVSRSCLPHAAGTPGAAVTPPYRGGYCRARQ